MVDKMTEYPIIVEYAPMLDSVSEGLEADLAAIFYLFKMHAKLNDNSP